MKAFLVLEDGTVYEGEGIGAQKEFICEIVFNTSMTGYTELLTDPSYAQQGVVMTYPIVGSYGVCAEDEESERPWLSAIIVRELNRIASNFRSQKTLGQYLIENDIPGISGIDTRALTKHLRSAGTMRGMGVYADSVDVAACVEKIRQFAMSEMVSKVCSHEIIRENRENGSFHVALVDYGAKRDISWELVAKGCKVTWFPATTSAEEILAVNPDGIVLSNGPGDPKLCPGLVQEVKKLLDSGIPMLGICLGHQFMALASGFDTYKLPYGHRGGNHPVRETASGKVYITLQNHGYCVDEKSVDPAKARVSYTNVNDGSVEGLEYIDRKAIGVQFHPAATAGPRNTAELFDRFIAMMGGNE